MRRTTSTATTTTVQANNDSKRDSNLWVVTQLHDDHYHNSTVTIVEDSFW